MKHFIEMVVIFRVRLAGCIFRGYIQKHRPTHINTTYLKNAVVVGVGDGGNACGRHVDELRLDLRPVNLQVFDQNATRRGGGAGGESMRQEPLPHHLIVICFGEP